MKETYEPIAGNPPYQQGYYPMGYLQQMPSLRLIGANEKLVVVESIAMLPEVLQVSDVQPIYIAAELLLNESSKEVFISTFTPDERLRILVTCPENSFDLIEKLRALRGVSSLLPANVKLPICCYIHSFTEYLYALIAQTDELIADESEQHLTTPENRLLLANTLVCNTIDPFY